MLGYDSDTAVDHSLDALRLPFRRRLVFSLLKETNAPDTPPRCDIAAVFAGETDETYMELYHVHLPKLDSLEFVDWLKDDWIIEPGPRWNDIEPILTVLHEHLNELPPALRGTPTANRGTN